MRTIKLTVEYDGTEFNGWQVQPNGQRTVQGELEDALAKITKSKTRVIGSGRTDRHVHASGQVAHFKTKSKMSADEFVKALNANLSYDVAVLHAEEVGSDFHAQYTAKSKTYRYSILNRSIRSTQQRRVIWFYPHKLNLSLMRREAEVLVGKHDFKSFQAKDPSKKREDTVRTVKRLDIKKKDDVIHIDIEANGFLYKMVRNIVGTLVEIGSGQLPEGSIKSILTKKDRGAAGATAPANGLCLVEVFY